MTAHLHALMPVQSMMMDSEEIASTCMLALIESPVQMIWQNGVLQITRLAAKLPLISEAL